MREGHAAGQYISANSSSLSPPHINATPSELISKTAINLRRVEQRREKPSNYGSDLLSTDNGGLTRGGLDYCGRDAVKRRRRLSLARLIPGGGRRRARA